MLTGCTGWSNWAGNLHCKPSRIVRPNNEAGLRAAVQKATRLRVVGTGHSWSGFACTDQVLIDTRSLVKVLDFDVANGRIKVETGIRLRELCASWAEPATAI